MTLWTSDASPFALPLQPPDTKDQLDRMEEAARKGDLETVKSLTEECIAISDGAFFLYSSGGPLYFAVQYGCVQILEYFFSQGATFYFDLAKEATRNKDIAMLETLLLSEWNINEPRNAFMPPLLTDAVVAQRVTKWYLLHGANPNEGCQLDFTPLSHAVKYASFEVIKMLFDHCGSVKLGQLLHHAAHRELEDQAHVLEYLVDKGMKVNDIMYQNRMDNCNMQKNLGMGTPLHEAADSDRLEGVRWLVAHGANPCIRDSPGKLPIDRAQARGKSSVVEYLSQVTDEASEPEPQWTDGRRGEVRQPNHIEGVVYA